jgi:cold shock CspA family protein
MSSPIKQEHQTTTVKKELGNVSLPSHPLPSPGPPILKKIDYSAAASGDLFLHPAKLTKTLSYDHIVKHRIRLLDSNNSNPVAQQNVSGVDSSAITNTPGESISVIKPKNYRDPSIPFSTLRVKWFAAEKGYGFGVPIDAPATSQNPETSSPDDVFLHQLHIYGSGYRYLFDTQIVEAKIVIETKKNGTSKRVGRMITGIGSQPIVNVEPGLPRAQQKGKNTYIYIYIENFKWSYCY